LTDYTPGRTFKSDVTGLSVFVKPKIEQLVVEWFLGCSPPPGRKLTPYAGSVDGTSRPKQSFQILSLMLSLPGVRRIVSFTDQVHLLFGGLCPAAVTVWTLGQQRGFSAFGPQKLISLSLHRLNLIVNLPCVLADVFESTGPLKGYR
jgi:hypothetical protein